MTLASAVSTCQDHANKHAYDKSSLSEQFRLSMRNESGGIKKNKGIEGWHLLNDIDWQYVWVWGIRTYVCVCVCLTAGWDVWAGAVSEQSYGCHMWVMFRASMS